TRDHGRSTAITSVTGALRFVYLDPFLSRRKFDPRSVTETGPRERSPADNVRREILHDGKRYWHAGIRQRLASRGGAHARTDGRHPHARGRPRRLRAPLDGSRGVHDRFRAPLLAHQPRPPVSSVRLRRRRGGRHRADKGARMTAEAAFDGYQPGQRVWIRRSGSWQPGIVLYATTKAVTIRYRPAVGRGTCVDTV